MEYRDRWGRYIACGVGNCPLDDDAKYCKYCKSGQCEADKPKKENSWLLKELMDGNYVMYGGIPVRRNGR